MHRGVKAPQPNGKPRDDLEPYRRLVDLQKQLITVARKNEQARQECAALQEKITAELIQPPQTRNGLGQRMRQKANLLLNRISRFTRD